MPVKTPLKILADYFNTGDGKRSVRDFAAEIKGLTDDDKAELIAGICAITGDTVA